MMDEKTRARFWILMGILWLLIGLRIAYLYRHGKPAPCEPGDPPSCWQPKVG